MLQQDNKMGLRQMFADVRVFLHVWTPKCFSIADFKWASPLCLSLSLMYTHTHTPIPRRKRLSLRRNAIRWLTLAQRIQCIPAGRCGNKESLRNSVMLNAISPKKTYRWLRNTWKDAQHHSLSEKCKSKPQWGTLTRQSGWLLSKSLQAINAGEGVEKREPSYTVGGNAN